MTTLAIGFTGTQHGMTAEQSAVLKGVLQNYKSQRDVIFHHGDCIGADAEAHDIAEALDCEIVIHPPKNNKKRAFKKSPLILPPDDYKARDQSIVDVCKILLACPRQHNEILRSGTWLTIRYARKKNKPIWIIDPWGWMTVEENLAQRS